MGGMKEYMNKITVGDMIELSKDIPDNSIDCIFTDPPYPKKYRFLYDELAIVAERVLKPMAPCFVYSGNDGVEYVIKAMTKTLKYRATIAFVNSGGGQIVWSSRFVAKYKPVFLFHKLTWHAKAPMALGVFTVNRDKEYHEWGQGVDEAFHYLRYHTKPGDIVFDPFCGGGTTAVAARMLGRRFITFEINEESAGIAKSRLEESSDGIYQEQEALPTFDQLGLQF